MSLREILRVALGALKANALRSLLTMLGIIIGIGSVITMVALAASRAPDSSARYLAGAWRSTALPRSFPSRGPEASAYFGVWPAHRAARLDAIDALRYES